MAESLVSAFAGQKEDVEPEMARLGQKWDDIVAKVERRLKARREFKMVEVVHTRKAE